MRQPTARQRRVYDAIRAYIGAHGYPPTLREIGAAVGIRSTNGVHEHLTALEAKGLISLGGRGLSRAIVVLDAPSQRALLTEDERAVVAWLASLDRDRADVVIAEANRQRLDNAFACNTRDPTAAPSVRASA